MATYRITGPDGSTYEIKAPEGATPDQVKAFAQAQFGAKQGGNARDGGIASGIGMGLRDPIDAGAQMLRRLVPESVGNAVDSAGNWLADQGLPVARSRGVQGVDAIVKGVNQQYDADREAAGREGFDWARLGGNVASPVNLALPSVTGARTVGQLATRGAAAGAAGAALQPVTEDTENFWTEKAKQASLGAATGGVVTPALAKGAEKVVPMVADRLARRPAAVTVVGGGVTRGDIEAATQRLLQSQGMRLEEAPPAILQSVQRQIRQALASGAQLNPEQALRLAQAEAIGMTGDAALTLGQATRNPLQWAREGNLSGVMIDTPAGPRNPLAERFARQNQVLRGVLDGMGAGSAADNVLTGEAALSALQAGNQRADDAVRAAYTAFRESTGRDLEVPLTGLAQDYAATLDTFGEVIPAAVRKKFESLGLLGGTQRQLLTLDGAEKLIKVINANTDPANKPAFRALGELRGALERAISEAADTSATGAGAEAAMLAKEARSTAAGVFQTRREIPALAAAANDIAPDRFVQQFILSPARPFREVAGMADVLRQDPQAWQMVRASVAEHLRGKAFGTDRAVDKTIAPDRFARALDAIGPQKLAVIFTPDEVVRLNIAAQVAAQLESVPAGAKNARNYSNTAAGIFNLLQGLANSPVLRNIPGARALANQAGEIANERAIGQALGPVQAAAQPRPELTPEQLRALQRLFAPAAVGAGAAAGSGF